MLFRKMKRRILDLELRVAELETEISKINRKQYPCKYGKHKFIKVCTVSDDHYYDDAYGGGCNCSVYDVYKCALCGREERRLVNTYEI